MTVMGNLRAVCACFLVGFGAAAPVAGQEASSSSVVATALAPEAARLRTELERSMAGWDPKRRTEVLDFYSARDSSPFWGGAAPERGAALLAALNRAGAHGLPPSRYAPGALAAALAAGASDPASVAAAELAATVAYLAYARDLTSGLLTPSEVDPEIDVRPRRPEPARLLERLQAEPLERALTGLEPTSPEYRALMAEKARLEAAATADWGPEAPAGPTLRLGDSGVRVAALRARLAARGHVAAGADSGADPAAFDEGLKAALAAFQAEMGLEPDGLAGSRSLAALNAGPEARLKAVIVNLERLRWMNGALEGRYLYANIPDYTVKLVEDGATTFVSRTIVGKAELTRTPEFSDVITYMVVNPTWHIPDSIAQRVYLPKLAADPTTLATSNMRIFTRAGTEIDPGLVDFTQFSSGNFPFRIKQNPSEANALGRVKFMFPNQFSIYLHDTPTRGLFAKAERAFSNGCIRVEEPIELAHRLLADQFEDPQAAFDAWLAAKAEKSVTLSRSIPVHIVYRTVFLDDAGRVQHRVDVYGRDAKVFEALAAAGVTFSAAQG